jgi:ribosomal-protein-alanine N-acetyltransferase
MIVSRLMPQDRDAVRTIAQSVWTDMDIEAELAMSYTRLWVARPAFGQDPVAFLLAWAVADELHILWLATRPDARRRGAARAMLAAAIEYAAGEHVRLVLLEVRRNNRDAIRLYRSAGFHAIGVRRGYYERDAEDAILMTLTLDPNTGSIQPGRDEILLAEA